MTERHERLGQCPVEAMNVGDVRRLARALGVTTESVLEASLSITNDGGYGVCQRIRDSAEGRYRDVPLAT